MIKQKEKLQKILNYLKIIGEKDWGKKCKEYNVFCACCRYWRTYEDLKSIIEFYDE